MANVTLTKVGKVYEGEHGRSFRAVDAVDLCYQSPHIDLFVLIVGSQAQPALVQALRARGKEVLGYGPSSAAAVYAEFGASFIKMADDVRS